MYLFFCISRRALRICGCIVTTDRSKCSRTQTNKWRIVLAVVAGVCGGGGGGTVWCKLRGWLILQFTWDLTPLSFSFFPFLSLPLSCFILSFYISLLSPFLSLHLSLSFSVFSFSQPFLSLSVPVFLYLLYVFSLSVSFSLLTLPHSTSVSLLSHALSSIYLTVSLYNSVQFSPLLFSVSLLLLSLLISPPFSLSLSLHLDCLFILYSFPFSSPLVPFSIYISVSQLLCSFLHPSLIVYLSFSGLQALIILPQFNTTIVLIPTHTHTHNYSVLITLIYTFNYHSFLNSNPSQWLTRQPIITSTHAHSTNMYFTKSFVPVCI